jgi:hypothetical protein
LENPPGTPATGVTSLFNIAEGPAEKRNLLKEKPDLVESPQKEYAAWQMTLADPKWVTLYQPGNKN